MTRPTGTAAQRPTTGGTHTGGIGPSAETVAGAPVPAHDLRSACRLVARRARGWLTLWTAVGLALIVLVPAAIALAVDRYGSLGSSIWQFVGTPLGWSVFALAVVVGSVSLPLYVAYGISRRAVLQTYAVLGSGLALAIGLVMALGYAAEGALYAQLGATQELTGAHLYDDPSQWWLVTVEHALLGATMLLTGWVVGLAFARYEWGVGLALTAAAFVPYGLGVWALAAASAAVVVTVWVAGVAVLGVAAYLLGRDFPVRPKSG